MDINDVAVSYLAYRARTSKEMHDYLLKKSFNEDEIANAIAYLKDRKYLDDVSYVNQYLRYGFSKGKALYRIKKELEQKGINSFDIEDGIFIFEDENQREISEIERENAVKVAEKMLSSKVEVDKKLLDKVGRRLNTLGYSSGIIYSILNEYR